MRRSVPVDGDDRAVGGGARPDQAPARREHVDLAGELGGMVHRSPALRDRRSGARCRSRRRARRRTACSDRRRRRAPLRRARRAGVRRSRCGRSEPASAWGTSAPRARRCWVPWAESCARSMPGGRLRFVECQKRFRRGPGQPSARLIAPRSTHGSPDARTSSWSWPRATGAFAPSTSRARSTSRISPSCSRPSRRTMTSSCTARTPTATRAWR